MTTDPSTLEDLPAAINRATARLSAAWHRDGFPSVAEYRRGGRTLYKHWRSLTIGDCEQLVGQHTRAARLAIIRFQGTGSPSTARTAAEHILRTRLYRGLYRQTLGLARDEGDMPFPLAICEGNP